MASDNDTQAEASHNQFYDDQMKIRLDTNQNPVFVRAEPLPPPQGRLRIHWTSVIIFTSFHLVGIYGLWLLPSVRLSTLVFTNLLYILSSLGITAGAHRLWSHRAFRANLPVRILLAACFILAFQWDIYYWARNHRVHHKYSETDADPTNANRGFFFAHIGWMLVRKHPEVRRRGRAIDMSDLDADPVVRFQRQYYSPLVLLIWGVLPACFAHYQLGEPWIVAICVCVFARWMYVAHITFLGNSIAHMYGDKPYSRKLGAMDTTVRLLLFGDGTHNYHHTFPWDYSSSELGSRFMFNPATAVIDAFARLGWVWDRKKIAPEVVRKRMQMTGDPEFYYSTKKLQSGVDWALGLASLAAPTLIGCAIKLIF